MWAGAVQNHATDGTQEDPQGRHGNDSDEDRIKSLEHVACSTDLIGLHKVWVFSGLLNYTQETEAEGENEMWKYQIIKCLKSVFLKGNIIK